MYAADDRVKGANTFVKHKESFAFGSLWITPLLTPCHTRGSVCYYVEDKENQERVVFTGDTLFVGGCGRFFEGTGKEMYESLKTLSVLPPDTQVFCGHEYTSSNLKFALHVDPQNEKIKKKLDWSLETSYTLPSTIQDELETNPFMRVDQPDFQKLFGESDPVKLMTLIREQKNNF